MVAIVHCLSVSLKRGRRRRGWGVVPCVLWMGAVAIVGRRIVSVEFSSLIRITVLRVLVVWIWPPGKNRLAKRVRV